MKDYEIKYASAYKKTSEVDKSECYMGTHNCGTCMHCRNYTFDWQELENSYCLRARKEA